MVITPVALQRDSDVKIEALMPEQLPWAINGIENIMHRTTQNNLGFRYWIKRIQPGFLQGFEFYLIITQGLVCSV
jgi:hypothetical protein